jgi:hypothetical protein
MTTTTAPGDPTPGNVLLTQSDLHRPVYPRRTAIHCMWDTRPFTCPPVGIPTRHDPDAHPTRPFETIGCFCSLACAAAYNMADHTVRSSERFERHALLLLLHHQQHRTRDERGHDGPATESVSGGGADGATHPPLRIAPERECLDFFGGDMSIARFRAQATMGIDGDGGGSSCPRIFRPPVRPSAVYMTHPVAMPHRSFAPSLSLPVCSSRSVVGPCSSTAATTAVSAASAATAPTLAVAAAATTTSSSSSSSSSSRTASGVPGPGGCHPPTAMASPVVLTNNRGYGTRCGVGGGGGGGRRGHGVGDVSWSHLLLQPATDDRTTDDPAYKRRGLGRFVNVVDLHGGE